LSKKRPRATYRPPPAAPWWRTWRIGPVALVVAGALALVGYAVFASGAAPSIGGTTAWATLGTRDVHSLAFDPSDARHLYFGHHNGLLESRDGGRSWQPTALRGVDAMNVRPGGRAALQIAGHDVYQESTDGGRSWTPVPNDLPGLDLHAFATDPTDPAHAWTYAVGFGLFESTDRGRHWELRQPGDWPMLTTVRSSGGTVLLGVLRSGMGSSSDGGRTWQELSASPGEIVSLGAAPDGSAIYAGTTSGLHRSTDGGRSWQPTPFTGTALTLAVAPSDPRVVALVDDKTRFFRSDDAGATWPGPR
jgi:photosystem II stability/assembly factor-like uncharacterized protein